MTLPRLDALMGYYENHPPVHLMVAAYLGVKPRPKRRTAAPDAAPGHPARSSEPSFFEVLSSISHG